MTQRVELEFNLRKLQEGIYSLELSYREAESDADIRLDAAQAGDIQLDLDQLQLQAFDPERYAQDLTNSFFASEAVRTMFDRARASAERLDCPLHILLTIDSEASELQRVYWELLRDPLDGQPLFLGEKITLARYLSSAAWRKVHLRPKAKLRALVMVASPVDLSDFGDLAPIPVTDEVERARQALGDIPLTALGGEGRRASLGNLVRRLQEERPDILYLVCHGALRQGQPYLWLEDEDGKAVVTSGEVLLTHLQELTDLPLLVVLASCQSAGAPGEAQFRAALGPRLSQIGVPAVVAMQGEISQATAAAFMASFFTALARDGQVDRAMGVGRGRVRQRYDYWMPVLFSRLRSGVIFAEPEAARRPVRLGWMNWTAFGLLVFLGVIAAILLLFPATYRQVRSSLPVVRCIWPVPLTSTKTIKAAVAEFNFPGDLPTNLRPIKKTIHEALVTAVLKGLDLEQPGLYCMWGKPASLAKKIDAQVLFYGDIYENLNGWYAQPKIYIQPELSGADELTGSSVFGKEFLLAKNLTDTLLVRETVWNALERNLNLITPFLEGVIAYKAGINLDEIHQAEKAALLSKAQAQFESVLAAWDADQSADSQLIIASLNLVDQTLAPPAQGKDILYLWLGNTYSAQAQMNEEIFSQFGHPAPLPQMDYELPEMDCELAVPDEMIFALLPPESRQAWEAYQSGWQLSGASPRLLLAMGNWWAKIDQDDAASQYYWTAIEQVTTSEQPTEFEQLTELKAHFNLGLLFLIAAQEFQEQSYAEQAVGEFSQIVKGKTSQEDLEEYISLRTQASYNLGRAYSILGDIPMALAACEQALVQTGDNWQPYESPWQYEMRWLSYLLRGYLYLDLAREGESSYLKDAEGAFQAVIDAKDKQKAPVDPIYILSAYDGLAQVYDAEGMAARSAEMCESYQAVKTIFNKPLAPAFCNP